MTSNISCIPASKTRTENPSFSVLLPFKLKNKWQCTSRLSNLQWPIKLNKNNLRHTTLENRKDSSVWEQVGLVTKFAILKIMIPLFSFTALAGIFMQIQISVNDYCFYPGLCKCHSPLVFFYTIFKELIFTQGSLIIIIYYCTIFSTDNFFKSKKIKNCFFFLFSILFFMYLIVCSAFRSEKVGNSLSLFFGLAFFSIAVLYVMIWAAILKKFDKQFIKRTILSSALFISLFLHNIVFKGDLIFVVIKKIKGCLDHDYALVFFKFFLTLYYVVYASCSNRLLFMVYKQLDTEKELSSNIIIFCMKIVHVDLYSKKSLNALTIPLTEAPSWFFFLWYFYNVFATYSRKSFFKQIYKTILKKIKLKHHKGLSTQKLAFNNFKDLKAGCIFETNLIIFLRLISYKVFATFMMFSNQDFLYQDCTLREREDGFNLYDVNMVLLLTIHTAMMVGIGVVVYAFKWKSFLFDYQVEHMTLLGRFIIFLACFAYADYSLQIYKAAFNALI